MKTQTGLTMVELMIVVTIAAILASIAVPSFSDLINNTRMSSTMSQLTSDLNRARSEAIKRNRRVLVCVRSTNTACNIITDWQNGWLVCYDEDQDGACDATSATNPNPIVVHQALNASLTLTGSSALIRFNPNGTQGLVGAAVVETLTLAFNPPSATNSIATIALTGNISKTP
jgi:type IV fimbrial biogenesis protein FimT